MAKIPPARLSEIVGPRRPVISSSGEVLTPADVDELRKGDGIPVSGIIKGKVTPVYKPKPTRKPKQKITIIPTGTGQPEKKKPKPKTTCPVCYCPISISRLPQHLERVHKRDPRDFRKKVARLFDKSQTGYSRPVKKGSIHDHLGTSDKRDAARGWAQAYRDGGKYGSFPIHDAFGDESNP